MDELHDLARRLVARGEPDTVELLASRAFHDADQLFAAADDARRLASDTGGDRRTMWRAIAEALDGAAVYALRVNAGHAHRPDDPVDIAASPPMSPVTISLGVIEEGLADPTDAGAWWTDLLAAVQQTLHLAGHGWMWNEIDDRIDDILDLGGDTFDMIDILREYVNLVD